MLTDSPMGNNMIVVFVTVAVETTRFPLVSSDKVKGDGEVPSFFSMRSKLKDDDDDADADDADDGGEN